jgi:hypothetical protein
MTSPYKHRYFPAAAAAAADDDDYDDKYVNRYCLCSH